MHWVVCGVCTAKASTLLCSLHSNMDSSMLRRCEERTSSRTFLLLASFGSDEVEIGPWKQKVGTLLLGASPQPLILVSGVGSSQKCFP